ncbi:MAG: peptidoglycan-binding protein [Patescibacteria group bacterium]
MKKISISKVVLAFFCIFSISTTLNAEVLSSVPSLSITHSLYLGLSGSEVLTLQNILKSLGFFSYPTATGYFGPLTKTAVIDFQRANGIVPIGIVGPLTRAHLSTPLQISNMSTTTIGLILPKVRSGTIIRSHADRTAPTIPTDLESSNITETTLSLDWSDSTDVGGSGFLKYILERCEGDGCTDFIEIGNPTTSSFDDADLSADTLYRYQIKAKDVAGNVSEYSSILDVTTLPIPTYSFTVAKSGSGNGVVMSTPAGIACGSTCSSSYSSGTTVTLTASADAGSTFSGWSGACSGTGPCVVTLDNDTTVTATFTLNTYALNVILVGDGMITSTPAGIACGSTCSHSFASGSIVTLTASPGIGATFLGWTGGGCSGTGTCMVTMSTITTVTATFLSEA